MVKYETWYSKALWDMLRHLNLDHGGTGGAQMVLNREGQQMQYRNWDGGRELSMTPVLNQPPQKAGKHRTGAGDQVYSWM